MCTKGRKRGPRKAAFALWGKEEQRNEREMTFCKKSRRKRYGACDDVEQVRGIEPPCSAWEADILPLNYTCVSGLIITDLPRDCKPFFPP